MSLSLPDVVRSRRSCNSGCTCDLKMFPLAATAGASANIRSEISDCSLGSESIFCANACSCGSELFSKRDLQSAKLSRPYPSVRHSRGPIFLSATLETKRCRSPICFIVSRNTDVSDGLLMKTSTR